MEFNLSNFKLHKPTDIENLLFNVGEVGFEPTTFWSQTKRASQATLLPVSNLTHLFNEKMYPNTIYYITPFKVLNYIIQIFFWQ